MTYEQFRLSLIATAEEWERAADIVHERRPDLEKIFNSHAKRCRYLAEYDPEVRDLFEHASA